MATDRWKPGFHLAPPTGWLNDPNGLCQFRGVYHVFHQYSPDWPAPDAPRGWGHATSTDLVHWHHHGMAISPDTPDETSGSYSGCAVVVPHAASDGGDLLRLYYTGNVKEPGAFDYVHDGRRATQILIESDDGMALGPKQPLLREKDYPAWCTRHVRDPKVWRDDDGTWWMLLGTRDTDDCGRLLVMRSDDGLAWSATGDIRPDAPFGFMWECPDRIVLDGHVYLSFCPQGMADRPWAHGMRDQAGYIALADGRDADSGTTVVPTADFVLWDHGFDFYAPQTFVDKQGRTLLIGWMGMPEAPFTSAPDGLAWCHCLTVPRVLSRTDDGLIAQNPAPELDALHVGEALRCVCGTNVVGAHRADVRIEGIEGPFFVTLDGVLEIGFDGHELIMRFADPHGIGAGRTERRCPVNAMRDLRILVDESTVEVFANGGRTAMTTRWFPCADELSVTLDGSCRTARTWGMAQS